MMQLTHTVRQSPQLLSSIKSSIGATWRIAVLNTIEKRSRYNKVLNNVSICMNNMMMMILVVMMIIVVIMMMMMMQYWCWHFWSYDASHEDIASCREVVFRAWDEGNNTQVCTYLCIW